jgi:predicted ABC-type ATPase
VKVYDPYSYRHVVLEDSTTADPVGAFLPVYSESGKWFAVHTPTGESFRLRNLTTADRERVEVSVETKRLCEALYLRANWIEDNDPPPPLDEDEYDAALTKFAAVYGLDVVKAAVAYCEDVGHRKRTIVEALYTCDYPYTPDDLMDGLVLVDPSDVDESLDKVLGRPLTEALGLTEGYRDPQQLKAIFLAGAGGSGKSAVGEEMFAGTGFKVISQDRHLEKFLRESGIPFGEAGWHYNLFTRARDLKKKELRYYAQQRRGVIVDSTGWAFDRIFKPVQRLRANGYDVYMVFVTTSLEKALERNKKRAEAGGRDVPPSYIDDAWRGAHRNLDKYKQLFGKKNFFVIDNEKDLTPHQWKSVLSPAVSRIARRIMDAPIKNKKGQAWLAKAKAQAHKRLQETEGSLVDLFVTSPLDKSVVEEERILDEALSTSNALPSTEITRHIIARDNCGEAEAVHESMSRRLSELTVDDFELYKDRKYRRRGIMLKNPLNMCRLESARGSVGSLKLVFYSDDACFGESVLFHPRALSRDAHIEVYVPELKPYLKGFKRHEDLPSNLRSALRTAFAESVVEFERAYGRYLDWLHTTKGCSIPLNAVVEGLLDYAEKHPFTFRNRWAQHLDTNAPEDSKQGFQQFVADVKTVHPNRCEVLTEDEAPLHTAWTRFVRGVQARSRFTVRKQEREATRQVRERCLTAFLQNNVRHRAALTEATKMKSPVFMRWLSEGFDAFCEDAAKALGVKALLAHERELLQEEWNSFNGPARFSDYAADQVLKMRRKFSNTGQATPRLDADIAKNLTEGETEEQIRQRVYSDLFGLVDVSEEDLEALASVVLPEHAQEYLTESIEEHMTALTTLEPLACQRVQALLEHITDKPEASVPLVAGQTTDMDLKGSPVFTRVNTLVFEGGKAHTSAVLRRDGVNYRIVVGVPGSHKSLVEALQAHEVALGEVLLPVAAEYMELTGKTDDAVRVDFDTTSKTEDTPFVCKIKEQIPAFSERLGLSDVVVEFLDVPNTVVPGEIVEGDIRLYNANTYSYKEARAGVELPIAIITLAECVADLALACYTGLQEANIDKRQLALYAAAPKAFKKKFPEVHEAIQKALNASKRS